MRSDDPPSGAAPAAPEGSLRLVSWNFRGGCARKGAYLTSLAADLAAVPEAGPTGVRETTLEWAPADAALAGPRPELGLFAFGAARMRVLPPDPGDAASPLIAAQVDGRCRSRPSPSAPGRPATAPATAATPRLSSTPSRATRPSSGTDPRWCWATSTPRRRSTGRAADATTSTSSTLSASWAWPAPGTTSTDATTATRARAPSRCTGGPTRPPCTSNCFVPREWLPRVRTAWIGAPDPWLSRSDHLRLVVDVALREG